MVVVILIGVLTVTAIPTMAEARYNARTLDDATMVAELFRTGRTRAMARGAAMLLQVSSANAQASADLGTFMLYEAQSIGGSGVTPPLPVGAPLSSCGSPTTVWSTIISNAATTLIDQVNFNRATEQNAQIWATIADTSGAVGAGSLCYTPLGRAYYQATATPSFTPGVNLLHGELQIALHRSGTGSGATGLTRTVIVPDSGSTRIVSK